MELKLFSEKPIIASDLTSITEKTLKDFLVEKNISSKNLNFWQENYNLLVDFQENLAQKVGKINSETICLLMSEQNMSFKQISKALATLEKIKQNLKKAEKLPLKSENSAEEKILFIQRMLKRLHLYNNRETFSFCGDNANSLYQAIAALVQGEPLGDCKIAVMVLRNIFEGLGLETKLYHSLFFRDGKWNREHLKLGITIDTSREFIFETVNNSSSLSHQHLEDTKGKKLRPVIGYYEYLTQEVKDFRSLLSFILIENIDNENISDLEKLYEFDKKMNLVNQLIHLDFFIEHDYKKAYKFANNMWIMHKEWLNNEIEKINNNDKYNEIDKKIKINELKYLFSDFLHSVFVVEVIGKYYIEIINKYKNNFELKNNKINFTEFKLLVENIKELISYGFTRKIKDIPAMVFQIGGEKYSRKYIGSDFNRNFSNDKDKEKIEFKNDIIKLLKFFEDKYPEANLTQEITEIAEL